MKQLLRIILYGGLIGGIFGILKGLVFALTNAMFIHQITSIILLGIYFGLAIGSVGIFFGFGFAILVWIVTRFKKVKERVTNQTWLNFLFNIFLAIFIFISSLTYFGYISEFRLLVPKQTLWLLGTFGILQIITSILLIIYAIKRDKFALTKKYRVLLIPGSLILIVFLGTTILVKNFERVAAHQHTNKPSSISSITTQKNNTKIILFAWDGASWDIINLMLKQGKLPNLQKLINQGASGRMKSMVPTKSPVIWTVILTGKPPLKNGIYEFVRIAGFPGIPEVLPVASTLELTPKFFRYFPVAQRLGLCSLVPTQQTDREVKAIWDILGEQKKSVGIINLWNTYPTEPVNGFMVSQYQDIKANAPHRVTYPENLYTTVSAYMHPDIPVTNEKLAQFIPAVQLNPNLVLPKSREERESHQFLLNRAYLWDSFVAEIGNKLYQQFRPDLFIVYFEGGDVVSHKTWKYTYPNLFWGVPRDKVQLYKEILPRYYEYLDSLIEYYIQQMDENTILMVMSDHGFHAIPAWTERLYAWLGGPYISADHYLAPDGVFVVAGKGVKPSSTIDTASVFDITPTLLWLSGLPVAEDMDGKVITSVFNQNVFGPIQKIPTYEFTKRKKTQAARPVLTPEMEELLKSLGYIGK